MCIFRRVSAILRMKDEKTNCVAARLVHYDVARNDDNADIAPHCAHYVRRMQAGMSLRWAKTKIAIASSHAADVTRG